MSEQFFYFVQQLLNGLTIGSTYALIAIGYTMVYGIIGMINFAHGEVYMIGSYIAFLVIGLLMMLGIDSSVLLIGAAFLVAIVITSAYGWSIERVAYRPVRHSKRLIALISAIGMSIFLQNYVRLAQGSRSLTIPHLLPGNWELGGSGQMTISYMQVLIWVVTLISMLALSQFIRHSRMGRACRACAEDIKMTNLLGIDTNQVIALTFVIGAAMAAVAGVLLGTYYGVVNPYVGFMAGLKAFTAAVLGGIGSIPGAMLGGLLLGVVEALTAGYISTEYKDVMTFALLISVLLFMPSGILGRPEVERCNETDVHACTVIGRHVSGADFYADGPAPDQRRWASDRQWRGAGASALDFSRCGTGVCGAVTAPVVERLLAAGQAAPAGGGVTGAGSEPASATFTLLVAAGVRAGAAVPIFGVT